MSKERLGILRVSADLLEQMFCFPVGCEIVNGTYDASQETINFTLSYAALPEVSDRQELPRVMLTYRAERHPDAPDFRRITITTQLPGVSTEEVSQ